VAIKIGFMSYSLVAVLSSYAIVQISQQLYVILS